MSWEDFFSQNEKLVKHIKNQLKDTVYTPAYSEIFEVFQKVPFNKLKVVMVGDKPYEDSSVASGIAFASKNNQKTPLFLERIYEELERSANFKRPLNNNLELWLENGIFPCNFCFTCPIDRYKYKKNYSLLWEPFIHNLVAYISEHTSVVFILFGYKASTIRPSITEINCSVLEVAHPVYSYEKFKGCNCFIKARKLAGELGFTISWDL